MRTLKVFILSVLLLACCSWLMVTAALAEDGGGGSHNFGGYGIIYGPTSTGTDDFGAHGYKVGCYAPDRFYAAYLLCSGNNANYDVVLTNEQKAYLSNASTGAGFYELAQKFEQDTMPIYVLQYGAGNTWFAEYNNHDLDAAIEALRNVINGNVGGGGTPSDNITGIGDVVSGDYLRMYPNGSVDIRLYTNGGQVSLDAYSNYMFKVNDSMVTFINSVKASGRNCIATFNNISNAPNDFNIWNIPDGFTYVYNDSGDLLGFRNDTNATLVIYNAYFGKTGATSITGDSVLFIVNNGYSQYPHNVSAGVTYSLTNVGLISDSGASNTTPVTPPNNWPDVPQNPIPTEPDVPIHTGHGIDDLPEPNDYIEQPTYVTNVFTADLQGVIDALDEHCQHLQDAMYSNFQGYYDDITDFLWQLVKWLGSNINDSLNDLCDYLHDLFEWLADQFDYSVSGTGYNDNTVVSWLRKIYARLGGGTNTRPTDPVADPFDFSEWLAQLFGNFVAWLFGLGSEAVSGLVEDFETLITKFPFSIPWDLGAMLALLVTAPVTPVFEFPCYTFAGGTISQVGTYRIDMSAWDDVMNTVRPMEVLVFAFWLAFKVDFFKGIIELNKN